ncbi:MAG: hypothetical protein LQ351_006680 [Letrouitia transgressa]|nr:MAG: hypothetical protein LQ351_006680 [Letrouitia transgressa]
MVFVSSCVATLALFYTRRQTRANCRHQEVSIAICNDQNGEISKASRQTIIKTDTDCFFIDRLRVRFAELETEVKNHKVFFDKLRVNLDAANHRNELTLSMIPSATVSLSPVETSSGNAHGIYCHTATETHATAPSTGLASVSAGIAVPETQKSGQMTVQPEKMEKQKLRAENLKKQMSQSRFLAITTEESDGGNDESTTITINNPCETVSTTQGLPTSVSTDDHKE